MWNLLTEVGRWLWNGVIPSDNARAYLADLGRNTYIYCPMIAVGFMLIGLHVGWVGGYVIAAVFSIIPVVVMDVVRRLAADVPQVGKKAASWVNTAATPHTWLAITNFWFILLQPTPAYRPLAYLAILGIALFIVASGRWGNEPKWYQPLTKVSLILPVVFAIGNLTLDTFWPEELVAWKAAVRSGREQSTKNRHGQRYDQSIWRVVESGTGQRVAEHWYGDDRVPEQVQPNTLLWRTEASHRQFEDGGLYYAEYWRQTADMTMTPDTRNTIWFPESKVAAAGQLETRHTTLDKNTVVYQNNNGQPMNTGWPLAKAYAAEVTGNQAYMNGILLHFARLRDGTQTFNVWIRI